MASDLACFYISTLTLCIPAFGVSIGMFPYRPLAAALAFLLLGRVLVTVTVLLVGALGFLSPISLLVSSIILCIGWFICYSHLMRNRALGAVQTDVYQQHQTLQLSGWGATITLTTFLAFGLGFTPLLWRLWTQYHLVHPLSWDVVSYHFPNVADYMQTGSVWTTRGPFSLYPGGNEVLQLWSFVPLRSEALVGINFVTLVVGLFLVTLLILQQTLPRWHPLVGVFTCTGLWTFLFMIPTFRLRFLEVGRNDLEVGLWLLAVLWCLQEFISLKKVISRRFWLTASGVCLGMAIGIKPQAIYYIPAVALILILPWFPLRDRNKPLRLMGVDVCLYLLTPTLLLGGFWYIRNFMQYGSLTGSSISLQEGLSFSILFSLFVPSLYHPTVSLFILIIVALLLACLFYLWLVKKHSFTISERLTLSYSLLCFLAFTLTPLSSGYSAGSQWVYRIQLRYGVSSLFLVGALVALLLTIVAAKFSLFDRAPKRWALWKPNPSSKRCLSAISILLFTILSLQLSSYRSPTDLPGYSTVLFSPPRNLEPSGVYTWIHEHVANQTLLSFGLRPYGLYGDRMTNSVFYQLSSNINYQNLLALIANHQPDYLLLSRDPFTGELPPALAELRSQPDLFSLEYSDHLAVIYQVTTAGLDRATVESRSLLN